MRVSLILIMLLFCTGLFAQNINGKWYGKILQGPGELCQVCDFDVNLKANKKISGMTYSFDDDFDIRIGLSGYFKDDSIYLNEHKELIMADFIRPDGWNVCIKSFALKYHKIGSKEYLLGRGTGYSVEDADSICIPAKIVLSRNLPDLNDYVDQKKDSIIASLVTPVPLSSPPTTLANFAEPFKNTSIKKATEIVVHHTNLLIRLRDYLKIDNDTVTVYQNRRMLKQRIWISKRPVEIELTIDKKYPVNEILLFAENLGQIPPNTSELTLLDGDKSYRIMIESDLQKTAAIYLKYEP
ncbi:hypothetical protein GS399_19310 [Pedobacter sp. HMF7647]|uniref:Uncharacterized protein n=1 Tax=Hufsiella arboris TaxID=2695275 RepID=A0A7K1YFC8_9SPHI|nr:hypothetical protein [Hufsiella arboris]MXV53120.1 hypothetical protein [Hufsiella arboris]